MLMIPAEKSAAADARPRCQDRGRAPGQDGRQGAEPDRLAGFGVRPLVVEYSKIPATSKLFVLNNVCVCYV